MPTSPDLPHVLYVRTREAMQILGYTSLDSFYDALHKGFIRGAEQRGDGPRPRWWFRVSELAYVGPVRRPVLAPERLEADRVARLGAARPDGGFRNPFLKTPKAVA